MAKEKCPLCGGKIVLEYCDSCGFRVPNEEEISSTYDLSPDNYKSDTYKAENTSSYVPETVVREVIPEVTAEEIYPNPRNNNANANANPNNSEIFINPYAEKNMGTDSNYQTNENNQNPYANNSNNTNNGNPYQNVHNYNAYSNQNDFKSNFKGFFRETWWLLIIVYLFGLIGLIVGLCFAGNYRKRAAADSKYLVYAKLMTYASLIVFVLRMVAF